MTLVLAALPLTSCALAEELLPANAPATVAGDRDGDGRYDVQELDQRAMVAACHRFAPLATRTLGEGAEKLDEPGCSFLSTDRPFEAVSLVAVTGDRATLDAFLANFRRQNDEVTVLSDRSVTSTAPLVAVPGNGSVSRIDCGAAVFDLSLPERPDSKELVLEGEEALCRS